MPARRLAARLVGLLLTCALAACALAGGPSSGGAVVEGLGAGPASGTADGPTDATGFLRAHLQG